LTLVYNHHIPELAQKVTDAQHVAGAMVLAATHVHLDHHYCLEVIIIKGRQMTFRESPIASLPFAAWNWASSS
jgi:CopG family transcriptional regulator, nickel-responsive regulator